MAKKAGQFKIEDQLIFLDHYDNYSAKILCESLRKFFKKAWHNTIYGTIEQYERLLDYDPLLFDKTEGLVDLQLKE